MTISEKLAYIKGLRDGVGLDAEKPEARVIDAMLDLLGDISTAISDLDDQALAVSDELDEMEDSLDLLEDVVFGEDEDEDDEDDYESYDEDEEDETDDEDEDDDDEENDGYGIDEDEAMEDAWEHEGRVRTTMGVLNTFSVLLGVFVIFVLVAMLLGLFSWLRTDILHSLTLLEGGIR